MILPLAVYDAIAFGLLDRLASMRFDTVLATWRSGAGDALTVDVATGLILFCLAVLLANVVKAASRRPFSPLAHGIAGSVLVVFLLHMTLLPAASNALFLTLTAIVIVDFLACLYVAWRTAPRESAIGLG